MPIAAEIDWPNIAIGAVVSALIAFALGAFLPKGVVLTRELPEHYPDTWTIRNASPLPVRLRAVTWTGLDDGPRRLGIDDDVLRFAEESLETPRWSQERSWGKVIVPAGDILHAHVMSVHSKLVIEYRRAGPLGIFERRRAEIHGFP